VLTLVLGWAGGCTPRGPALPDEMTFDGVRLKKARDWWAEGVSGVVFVPPAATLPSASRQVGVLLSRKHASGAELSGWIMNLYRGSQTVRWYEWEDDAEACKIGVTSDGRPRPFVAIHVCREGNGVSACAELDDRLPEDDVGRCTTAVGCWERICTMRWEDVRARLEPIALEALGPTPR
jgi:hypothetical protein